MKLPKVESLIITVFLFCIALWAISKCSSRRSQFAGADRKTQDEQEERPLRRDTVFVPQAAPAQPQPQSQPQTYTAPPATNGGLPQLQNQPQAVPQTTPVATTPGVRPTLSNPPATAPPPSSNSSAKYSTLYITIDGLNMRKEPNLKSAVVARLKLDEAVLFLNKKSEKPEEINLGYEKVTDYWVKVRTKSGKDGWVFGAGVHYFKMKRKGVME